ncbi:hypothetical protein AGMMS49992_34030 [Clostridia bacterium]|nr:hypothetical protein AGMMS49992_34030 [Clostridia bacterium]
MAQRNPLPATPATPAASTGRYKLRLKEIRKAAGYSQAEMAELMKIHINTYYSYENELRKIPYDMLFYLADFFNVSIDYLLGYSSTPSRVM